VRRAVACFAVAVGVSYVWTIPGFRWDFGYDWLVTRAAFSGIDPALPLRDLAPLLGLHTELSYPHPRLPGALIAQAPIALLPWSWVYVAGRLLVVGSVVALLWILARLAYRPAEWFLMATPIALLVPGFSVALRDGNTGILVGALIAWTWLRGTGWGLGLAVTLKVWPWLIVPALFMSGYRRAAYQAAGLFAGLNLAGLALPSVSMKRALEVMERAQIHTDRSLALLPLWASLTVGLVFLATMWWREWDPRWSIPMALATAPVLWPSYLPALAVSWSRPSPPADVESARGRTDRGRNGTHRRKLLRSA